MYWRKVKIIYQLEIRPKKKFKEMTLLTLQADFVEMS